MKDQTCNQFATECITKQAAIEALNKLSESTYEVNYGVVDCDDAINAIVTLPPTEPKKGKWIKSGEWGRVYKCNQCGNYLDFDGVDAGRGSTNYCPNCGAKMERRTVAIVGRGSGKSAAQLEAIKKKLGFEE